MAEVRMTYSRNLPWQLKSGFPSVWVVKINAESSSSADISSANSTPSAFSPLNPPGHFDGQTCLPFPKIPVTLARLMARYTDLQGDGRAGQSRVGQIIGPETTLVVLALLLYLLRMFSRVRPTWNLSWDDLFITLGVVRIAFGASRR